MPLASVSTFAQMSIPTYKHIDIINKNKSSKMKKKTLVNPFFSFLILLSGEDEMG